MASSLVLSLLLLPTFTKAMIIGQRMEGHVIWAQDGQFIVDRGAEDGIASGEYVQVLQDRRYKSRAISLKIHTAYSLWGTYNVYEPLVLDKKISLKSSSRHPLTRSMQSSINFNIPGEEEFLGLIAEQTSPGPREEESDLQVEKRLKEKIEKRKETEGLASSYIESLDPDLGQLTLTINVAPASYSNISGSHELAYSISLERDHPEKNKIDGTISYERNSFVNSASSSVMSESRYDARLFYEHDRPTKEFIPFTFASFERVREHTSYPIRAAVNLGPVGIKYRLKSLVERYEFLNDMALSYAPALDYLRRDEFLVNGLTEIRESVKVSEVNFRHNMIFQMDAHFFDKKMNLTNMTFVRPIQELDGLGIDFSDLNLRIETEMKYQFHRHFHASYINLIRNDRRSKLLSSYPETEITHRMTVGYEKRF